MRLLLPLVLIALTAGAAPGPFPHDIHVTNFEVRCTECHAQGAAGLPQLERGVCLDCHEHEAPPFVAVKRAPLTPPFAHALHGQALDCLACHEAVLDDARVRGQPVMPRKDCASCHTQKGVKTALRHCEACHEGDQKQVRPKDHGAAWLDGHGLAAEARGLEQHGSGDCSLCHGSDACVRCHRERRPRSHTGLWDVRLHGTAASFDREGCKTCHETGLCVRCHQTTRPMNHGAAWGTLHGLAAAVTDNENCRACHTAAQCTNCHRTGL